MKKQVHKAREVEIELGGIAYIRMPRSEDNKKVATSMNLSDLVTEYKGVDIILDFSEDGELLGIEILAF